MCNKQAFTAVIPIARTVETFLLDHINLSTHHWDAPQ